MRFFKYQTQLGWGTRITDMARQLYILKVMGQYKSRWETGWHSQHPCSPCSTITEEQLGHRHKGYLLSSQFPETP